MKKRNTFKPRKSVPHWKRPRLPKKISRERQRAAEQQAALVERYLLQPLQGPSAAAGRSGG